MWKSRTLTRSAILQLVAVPQCFFSLLYWLKILLPVLAERKSCSSPCWQQTHMLRDQLHFCVKNDSSSMRHFLHSAPAWEWYPYNNKSRSSWNDIAMLSRCLWQIFPRTKALQILSPPIGPVCFGTPSKRTRLQMVRLLSIQLQLFTHQGAAIAQCHWLFTDPYAEVSHNCWALLKVHSTVYIAFVLLKA